jgi:hypothetical protein
VPPKDWVTELEKVLESGLGVGPTKEYAWAQRMANMTETASEMKRARALASQMG